MSIAITGPEKYDFQYLFSVSLMLQFHHQHEAKLLIEPPGGEDAELHFTTDNGIKRCFEIQVKGAKEPATLEKITEFLLHFPERQNDSFLLERLISSPEAHVVFISSARVPDGAHQLVLQGDWAGNTHADGLFKNDDAANFRQALLKSNDKLKATPLFQRRKQHVETFLAGVSDAELRRAMQRLIIIENVTQQSLTEKCRALLRRDFYIPDDLFDERVNALLDVVKAQKAKSSNALTAMLHKLHEKPVYSVAPKSYQLRGDEQAWTTLLSQEGILLFSGQPRMGKSNTARWIAAEFQQLGYAVLTTQLVDEAERFLLDPVKAPRLVLLDDPLGSLHPVIKPSETLHALKRLVRQLPSLRKLIVAQGQEILLEIAEAEHLGEVSVGPHKWIDLSQPDSTFLLSLWQNLQLAFQIPQPLFDTIATAIERDKLAIEPGCLSYLAAEFDRLPDGCDVQQLIRFARKDAHDLGRALKEQGCGDVLLGLAATTYQQMPVSHTELSFALTNSNEKAYGYSKILATSTSFGVEASPPTPFPVYATTPTLSENDNHSLARLEQRRMIEYNDRDETTFTHPFYRSAAESLFQATTRNAFERAATIINNGLFCLSPQTTNATARNLHWIYRTLNSPRDKTRVVELAISGLDSSYPSTRDICFAFLNDIISELDQRYQEQQTRWVHKVKSRDLNALQWHKGQPWYPMGDNVTIEMPWFDPAVTSTILNKLTDDTATEFNSEDAFQLINALKLQPERLTPHVMSRLLSVNEGLIRAQAAWIWGSIERKDDEDILARIFNDGHPAVAESMYNAVIPNWNALVDEPRKNVLFEGLKRLASEPVLAQAIIDSLLVFERPHKSGHNPPWKIFAALLPLALAGLPLNTRINFPRLSTVTDAAQAHLSANEMADIFDVWITLLEKQSTTHIPEDYALSITPQLMILSPGIRVGFIKRLLNLHGTGPRVRVISDLMHAWQSLSTREKDAVIHLLTSQREDKNWLKAAVLTSYQIPAELLALPLIPGYASDTFNIDAVPYLQQMPELFSAAVKMYVGVPQPLWYIGTHHRERRIWPKIIISLAKQPEHSLFPVAFCELIRRREEKALCEIIQYLGELHTEALFEYLLEDKIQSNGDFMPEVWQALFTHAPSDTVRSAWISRMASHALTILDNFAEAKDWIPEAYLNEFYDHFKTDLSSISLITRLLKMHKESPLPLLEEDSGNLLILVKGMLTQSPLMHHWSCERVYNVMNEAGFSTNDLDFIEQHRLALIEAKYAEEDRRENGTLRGWIF